MQNNRDLLKIAIWVASGILAGAIITIGIQHLSSQRDQSPEQASAETESVAAPQETETAAPEAAAISKSAVESPYPVSAALAVLNNGNPAANPQTVVVAPGSTYTETRSGYPIYTGGRAVDSSFSGPVPVQVQQAAAQPTLIINQEAQPAAQPVGRNGLLSNPCVDPASVHGLAYRRQYNLH